MRTALLDTNLVLRTANKDYSNGKAASLEEAMKSGNWEKIPTVAVVHDPHNPGKYLVYSGNTRHYVAEKHNRQLHARIMESDEDLELLNREEPDMYWPGENLSQVAAFISNWRAYALSRSKN